MEEGAVVLRCEHFGLEDEPAGLQGVGRLSSRRHLRQDCLHQLTMRICVVVVVAVVVVVVTCLAAVVVVIAVFVFSRVFSCGREESGDVGGVKQRSLESHKPAPQTRERRAHPLPPLNMTEFRHSGTHTPPTESRRCYGNRAYVGQMRHRAHNTKNGHNETDTACRSSTTRTSTTARRANTMPTSASRTSL